MELVAKERNIIIKNAVENAYRSKLDNKDNLNLRQKLLSTGNAPIKYISQNNFLGVGPQGTGNNIVGKYLMQIRFQLRNAKIKQDRDYAIYEAYLAQKGLQTEILNGSDLSIYLGKSPSAIIDMIGRSVLSLMSWFRCTYGLYKLPAFNEYPDWKMNEDEQCL